MQLHDVWNDGGRAVELVEGGRELSIIVETLFALFNVLLWFYLLVVRPSHFTCPADFHDDGVFHTGHFTCTRKPVGSMDYDGTFGKPERSIVPPGVIRGRIYCTSGSMPVVVSDRAVGCHRGARWQHE